MAIKDADMQRYIDCRFQGLTKDQLIECGDVLNVTLPRQMKESSMRLKLCEKIGVTSGKEPEKEIPAIAPMAKLGTLFDPKPYLGVDGRWGGKRHNLIVFTPPQNTELSSKYFQLGWEGRTLYFAYDTKLSMAHPYYEALKGCIVRKLTQRPIRDDENIQTGVENIHSESQRFPHQYIGVVPGTEHLPESLCQYWQWQSEKHNMFRKADGKPYNRRILQGIRTDLYGPVGTAFYKDLTDEDILFDILKFLHGDNVVESLAA